MEILTLKEAADFLRISPSSLRRLCRERAIPFRQRGRGRIYFVKEKLVEWFMEDHYPEPFELRIKTLKLIRRYRKAGRAGIGPA